MGQMFGAGRGGAGRVGRGQASADGAERIELLFGERPGGAFRFGEGRGGDVERGVAVGGEAAFQRGESESAPGGGRVERDRAVAIH